MGDGGGQLLGDDGGQKGTHPASRRMLYVKRREVKKTI